MLKTVGYLISTLSVVLLGMVAWEATGDDTRLRACLVIGALASITGMLCRWLSYRYDEQPSRPVRAATSSRPSSAPARPSFPGS